MGSVQSARVDPGRAIPGLQVVPLLTPASPRAAVLATEVMLRGTSVSRSLELVAEHFLDEPRVDAVVAALTTFSPDERQGWVQLGQRAWLREWVRPGARCRVVPDEGAGPEAALTTPWMSPLARVEVVVIPDADDLPPEAEQDRREFADCGISALMASSQVADGTMYGSISVGSAVAGPWPEMMVADLRLLSAALTSRMAADQARRSLADAIALGDRAHVSQQQFFAAIGHELRTPISTVVGFAEVLAEEAAELAASPGRVDGATDRLDRFVSSVGKDAATILRAGEQLLDIVEGLLRTGRVLGDEEARCGVRVAEAVRDVVHWLRTPARAREVQLGSDVSDEVEVWATPAGLRQILTQLVSNAVVHNGGGGTVEITADRAVGESGEDRVRIAVRDSGRGLTPEQQRGAFEPFVRYAGRDVRGTGLGLPLCRAIAERHGGTVGVESAPGRGSTFWVELPAASA